MPVFCLWSYRNSNSPLASFVLPVSFGCFSVSANCSSGAAAAIAIGDQVKKRRMSSVPCAVHPTREFVAYLGGVRRHHPVG